MESRLGSQHVRPLARSARVRACGESRSGTGGAPRPGTRARILANARLVRVRDSVPRAGEASYSKADQSGPITRRLFVSILWIILIVVLVLALLGFFSRGAW